MTSQQESDGHTHRYVQCYSLQKGKWHIGGEVYCFSWTLFRFHYFFITFIVYSIWKKCQ